MNESHKKEFTGWWIPAYVVERFESGEINARELILLGTVHSLSKDTGCYASNTYLASVVRVKEWTVSSMIRHLREIGLLEQTKFDGRRRWLSVPWSRNPPSIPGTEPCELSQGSLVENHKGNKQANRQALKSLKRSQSEGSKTTPRTQGFFSSTEFDRKAAGQLRSLLMKHGCDLVASVNKRRGVKIETLQRTIASLRIDRGVSKDCIRQVLAWLEDHYSDKYVPKIRRADDLCRHWERYWQAFVNNTEGTEGVDKVASWEKDTPEYKAKVELTERVREWLVDQGYIEEWQEITKHELKTALKALGEKPNALTEDFVNS